MKTIKVKKTVRPIFNITWPPFIGMLVALALKFQPVEYKLLNDELSFWTETLHVYIEKKTFKYL